MKRKLFAALALLAMMPLETSAYEYNTVPPGEAQYAQCLADFSLKYQGGTGASPISGQTKAEAWCTCLWNETPDGFKGNLASFAETGKGKDKNAICKEYAGGLSASSSSTSQASALAKIDQSETALIGAWQETPFTTRRAIFVSEPASGFGVFKPHSNVFKPGEKIRVYIEPIAYGWKDIGDGIFEFGFTVDMLIKSSDGRIIGGKENFASAMVQSHTRNREFMLNLDLNLTGADAGDYVVEYKLHDPVKGQLTSVSLPFKLAT